MLTGRYACSAILKQMVRDAILENDKLKAKVRRLHGPLLRRFGKQLTVCVAFATQVEMLEGSQIEPRAISHDFSHSSDIPDMPLQGVANTVYGDTAAEPEPELVEDALSEAKKAVQGRLANLGEKWSFARIGAQPQHMGSQYLHLLQQSFVFSWVLLLQCQAA